MSGWGLVLIFGGLGLLCICAVIGLALAAPLVDSVQERARINRATHEASWQIHQRATEAFGELLDAARQDQHQEGGL